MNKGMTLVELLAVLAIAGILAMLAVPSLQGFVAEQRRQVVARELAAALRTARMEAITRQAPVVVRAFYNGWSWGWTTALDIRGLRNAPRTVLRRHVLDGQTRIVGNLWLKNEVRFDSSGAPTGTAGHSNIGSLYLCDTQRPLMRLRIVLDWVGRIRLTDQLDRGTTDACANPVKR